MLSHLHRKYRHTISCPCSLIQAIGSNSAPRAKTGKTYNWDAASIGGKVGGAVSKWSDLVNGVAMTPNGKAPVLRAMSNGKVAVDLDNTGMISTGNLQLNKQVTVLFAVQHTQNMNTWGSIAHHGNRDNDWALEHNGVRSDKNVVHWQSKNDNSGNDITLKQGVVYVLVCRIQGDTRTFVALGSDGSKTSVSAKGNSISPGLKRLYFGKSDIREVSHVVMAEMLYYDTALGAAELTAAQNYMTSKYLS